LEWVEWQKVRGPIGPDRWDFYAKFVAMHAGKPYEKGKEPTLGDFPFPWDPEPVAALTKPSAEERRKRGPIFIPPDRRRRAEA